MRKVPLAGNRCSVQFEIARLQLLKHGFRIIPARHFFQLRLACIAIARNNILKLAGVVHVHPVVRDTQVN